MADESDKRIIETEYRITFGEGAGAAGGGDAAEIERDTHRRPDRDRALDVDARDIGRRHRDTSVAQQSIEDAVRLQRRATLDNGRIGRQVHLSPGGSFSRSQAAISAGGAAAIQQQIDLAQNTLADSVRAAGKQAAKEAVEQIRSATIGRLATVVGVAALAAGTGEAFREGTERQSAAARLRFGDDRNLTGFERVQGVGAGAARSVLGLGAQVVGGFAGLLEVAGVDTGEFRQWLQQAVVNMTETDLEVRAAIFKAVEEARGNVDNAAADARSQSYTRLNAMGLPVWASKKLRAEIDANIRENQETQRRKAAENAAQLERESRGIGQSPPQFQSSTPGAYEATRQFVQPNEYGR